MITHRNAFLNVMGILAHESISPADRYLWTLPMFHANGWGFVWAITACGGTHICLRRVDPRTVFESIASERVTRLCAAPTVLIIAGSPKTTGTMLRAAPFSVAEAAAEADSGHSAAPGIARFAGIMGSLDPLDRAATGHGLVSVEPASGVIRRVPLVASIGGTLVPALSIEMLRVAMGAPSLRSCRAARPVRALASVLHPPRQTRYPHLLLAVDCRSLYRP
jgi:hypothetical protein